MQVLIGQTKYVSLKLCLSSSPPSRPLIPPIKDLPDPVCDVVSRSLTEAQLGMLGEVEKVYGILVVSTQETTMDTATQNLHGRHGSLTPEGHL